MKDLSTVSYHPVVEKLSRILCERTRSDDPSFFRIMASYYIVKVASMMRCSIATPDRGKIPVSMYAINLATCVDKDTEFLSLTGWKKISDYTEGDQVLTVAPHDEFKAWFSKPEAYINQPALQPAYRVTPNNRTKLSMMISPNHGMLYQSKSGSGKKTWFTKPAKEFFESFYVNSGIPSHFKQTDQSLGLNLTDTEIQIMVAFVADGTIKPRHSYKARIRVKKQRKIDRMRALLDKANLPYKVMPDDGSMAFWFNPPLLQKDYDWAWKANSEQLALITEESIHWDGCTDKRTGNYIFDTTKKDEADFMQYAYQATFDAVVSLQVQDRRGRERVINGKKYFTKSIDYRVQQSSAKIKNIQPKNVTREPMPDGREYCFTTSTGYWLMRKDNHITVTHNSGHGKGHSMNIFEDTVIKAFRSRFLESTFPEMSTKNINNIAVKRANRFGSDPDEMKEQMLADFKNMGPLLFSFDSGTPAAVKQMRDKLLMAGAGSMNLEIDEIGSNLIGQTDILNAFLELFDVGKLKQKLLKSTTENRRLEEIQGKTPTNMLLFGTPGKLMDGGKIEEETISFLEIGFARRCIFGYSLKSRRTGNKTAEEIYKTLTSKSADKYLQQISHDMEKLADSLNFNITLKMQKPVAIALLKYRLDCEKRAEKLPDHQDIQRAELEHRYFKAMKLAGGYAFIDKGSEILEKHLWQAIKLVEDSGTSLHQLLNRERPHVKLAKYIAGVNEDVTHSDIAEDLPLYKGSSAAKAELMKYAIGWGYKNNVIIKKFEADGIEFFRGEALHEVNMNEINVAYSTDVAVGYQNDVIPFKDIGTLTAASGYHFINHHLGDIK